jgi:hypothetical protein
MTPLWQPVPCAYGLFPFLFVAFFQGTPRVFTKAPEKVRLAAHFQNNHPPFSHPISWDQKLLPRLTRKKTPPNLEYHEWGRLEDKVSRDPRLILKLTGSTGLNEAMWRVDDDPV